MSVLHRTFWVALLVLIVIGCAIGQAKTETGQTTSIPYLKLTEPRHVMSEAQAWEGDQYPHTLSALELKRDGFRYWGWYGLNEGRGIGLARSNDLVNWTKPTLVATLDQFLAQEPPGSWSYAYFSLIDPAAPDLNFSMVGNQPYLYYVRFNSDGSSRVLFRQGITLTLK